jgi:hypothetical protein
VLGPDRTVRGSLDDLRNYFYCLRQAPGGTRHNPVGRRLYGSQVHKLTGGRLPPRKAYRACFKVQGMGDSNGPDIAQATHEALLRKAGCLRAESHLTFDTAVPAGDVWEGVYIDDHLILCSVMIAEVTRRLEHHGDVSLVAASEAAYDLTEGVSRAPEKQVRYKETFVAWGTEVRGRRGRVGAPLLKRSMICGMLSCVLLQTHISKKILERAVAQTTHPLMHRRELLSILSDTYLFMNSISYQGVYCIPDAIRSELVMLALCLPLCEADVRWPISEKVSATDATPTFMGACEAAAPSKVTHDMYRVSEHRGTYTRLDWPCFDISPAATRLKRPTAALADIVRSLDWHTTCSKPFHFIHHVNVQEMEALSVELQRVCTTASLEGQRRVVACDSGVCVGAWGKGRSSSKQLNNILRKTLAWSILGRVKFVLFWVATDVNPADDPSRSVALREPAPLPSWAYPLFTDFSPWRVPLPHHTAPVKYPVATTCLSPDLLDVQDRTPAQSAPAYLHVRPPAAEGADTAGSVSISALRPGCANSPCVNQIRSAARGEKQNPAPPPVKVRICRVAEKLFKELWSGCAGLTKAASKQFRVDEPIEAFPPSGYRPAHDLNQPALRRALLIRAHGGEFIWVHLGTPCTTWSRLRFISVGTRRVHLPNGDGSRDDERIANSELSFSIRFMKAVIRSGGYVSFENPESSLIWHHPLMVNFVRAFGPSGSAKAHAPVTKVAFDQCQFGLTSPPGAEKVEVWKKGTILLSNLPGAPKLGRRCTHDHTHVPVIASIRVHGKSVLRSKLAGAYPPSLCSAIVAAASPLCRRNVTYNAVATVRPTAPDCPRPVPCSWPGL